MVSNKFTTIAPYHLYVLKHVIMAKKEAEEVLVKYNCTANELALIFGTDPAIVGLGIKPGDMIKITRKSATAGESFYYRYVVEV